jgi:hypothetical protein
MPTVKKTHGGRVVVRDIGEFVPGELVDVSDDDAEYLCAERSGFEVVDDSETCDVVKSDGEVCGRDLPCPYHSDGDEADLSEEE